MTKGERMKEIAKASPDFGKRVGYKMCVVDEFHDMKELLEENAELKRQVEQKQHLADVRLEQSLENYKLFSDERKARIDVDIALDNTTDQLTYAKTIIQDLLDNTDEYARQRAKDFLKESKLF